MNLCELPYFLALDLIFSFNKVEDPDGIEFKAV